MPTEHPIALELISLKAALDKYQHAAHTSSLQLQRAHLEATEADSRSRSLEADNARLQHEIDFLRANPDSTPTSLQISELTLALRRVSDKLSLTEDILLKRTTELIHTVSEKSRIQLELAAVRAEFNRARKREETFHLRERDLEQKLRAAEEETKMSDAVVMEYADLVRSLEGRRSKPSDGDIGTPKDSSLPSSPIHPNGDTGLYHQTRGDSLVQSLTENRFSLQRLLREFNSETSNLQAEITRLHSELSCVRAELDSERESARLDRIKLAEALLEVDHCKTDDGAAAKIVSRYMQFSQSSIQTAISTIKSRHAASLATLTSSSETVAHAMTVERKRASQLRDALDELTEDISRETFGRRREVSLRLQSIVREERTVEALNAWLRRAEERRSRLPTRIPATDSVESSQIKMDATSEELEATLDFMIQGALTMIASLSPEEPYVGDVKENSSLARLILAEEMVRSLSADLGQETEKRMALTRAMAKELFLSPPTSSAEAEGVQAEDSLRPPLSELVDKSPTSEGDSLPFPSMDANPALETTSSYPASNVIDPSSADAVEKISTVQNVAVRRTSQTERQDEVEISFDNSGGAESTSTPRFPLLTELTRVSHRYDNLQRGFRDCQSTLAKLKVDITPIASASRSGIPVLQNVIHRLDDFCEDTRVELEIRIADEERITKGFETLLGVPGALVGEKEKSRVELELKAFLDGTTPSVVKTVESCTSKLDDLQHDIAQVKRALHESIEAAAGAEPHTLPKTPPGWSSWTPPFLSASPTRPSSPAPSFGTVITAPRPRRMSSNPFISLPSRFASESNTVVNDPYAHLGLRISMPSQGTSGSPSHPMSARLRKTSASSSIYLLGLGSGSGFFSKQEVIPESTPRSALSQESDEESETLKNEGDVE